MSTLEKGALVQVHQVILSPAERSAKLPDDTSSVPFEMRVNGFLDFDAAIGDKVTITTMIGRKVQGIMIKANPSYDHNFGKPVPELLQIGAELKKYLIAEKGGRK